MPSLAELEAWLEEQWPQSLAELPGKISETAYTYTEVLYEQLNKYGPPAIPALSMPALQAKLEEHLPSFTRADAALPPPPPPTRIQRVTRWIGSNRYTLGTAFLVSAVGLGLAYQRYPSHFQRLLPLRRRGPSRRPARVRNGIRREAVVVLGADTAIGRTLTASLAAQNLIVIAVVSSTASLNSFDSQLLPSSRGYVAVRHLDLTKMPESIDSFAQEVHATLALRFPLTAAGDPFARPGDNACLIGIVNALSYVAPEGLLGPLNVAGAAALSHGMNKHVIGPLAAISALLPEARISTKRMYSANPECLSPVTIISLIAKPNGSSAPAQRLLSDAARSGSNALREEIASAPGPRVPSSQTRQVRMTTIDICTAAPSFLGLSQPSARPALSRSPSSSWQQRDSHTTVLREKVADLVLPVDENKALRKVYRIRGYTPVSWRDQALHFVPSAVVHWLDSALTRWPFPVLQSFVSRRGSVDSRRSRRQTGSASSSASSSQSLVRSTFQSARPGASAAENASVHGAASEARAAKSTGSTAATTVPSRAVREVLHSPSPYTQSATGSGTPSQIDLETPSNIDTGSSGDEKSSNEDGYVLHSAPSSADGEEDARWRQNTSPWLGAQRGSSVASSRQHTSAGASSSAHTNAGSSELEDSRASLLDSSSGAASDSAGAPSSVSSSWVRLGDSAHHEQSRQQ